MLHLTVNPKWPVLRIRIRSLFDPWILDPGWVKNQDPGSEMNISDHISESLEAFYWLKILIFFDADPDPRSRIFLVLVSGWKNSDMQHWIWPITIADLQKFNAVVKSVKTCIFVHFTATWSGFRRIKSMRVEIRNTGVKLKLHMPKEPRKVLTEVQIWVFWPLCVADGSVEGV
jgi:hypothetical protein